LILSQSEGSEIHSAHRIHFEDGNIELLSNFNHVVWTIWSWNAKVFGWNESILTAWGFHQRTLAHKPSDCASECGSNFGCRSEGLDHVHRHLGLFAVNGADCDSTVLLNINLATGFARDLANCCSAWPDQRTNLFWIDLHCGHARCVVVDFGARG
jgi:hypothetical protein